jgi:hypothetical protein
VLLVGADLGIVASDMAAITGREVVFRADTLGRGYPVLAFTERRKQSSITTVTTLEDRPQRIFH